jgi:hypothetical protein
MPIGNKYGLMVIFETAEPSEKARKFLKSLNGVEVAGVWFLPNGAPPNMLLSELQGQLSSLESNKGVAVIRVSRIESHASIQGFPFLHDWFRPEF